MPVALNELVEDAKLLTSATVIAAANNHKIYDCLYLALAIERREPLATADRRLGALAQTLGIDVELIEAVWTGEPLTDPITGSAR